jgi:hypothetical protein
MVPMSTNGKRHQGRVTLTPAERVEAQRAMESANYFADLMVRRVMVGQWMAAHDADDTWRRYQVHDFLVDGQSGHLKLSHFEGAQDDQARIVYILEGGEDRDPSWGRFVRLTDARLDSQQDDDPRPGIWMSDTRAEIIEHMPLIKKLAKLESVQAEPTVLITGLGLGMAVRAALLHGASRVDVIELDPDVIALTGDQFIADDRVRIWQADAFEAADHTASYHWDVAWHDIWPTISDLNLPQMEQLKKAYKATWTGAWQEAGCKYMARILKLKDEYEEVMGPIEHQEAMLPAGAGYLDPVLKLLQRAADAEAKAEAGE